MADSTSFSGLKEGSFEEGDHSHYPSSIGKEVLLRCCGDERKAISEIKIHPIFNFLKTTTSSDLIDF